MRLFESNALETLGNMPWSESHRNGPNPIGAGAVYAGIACALNAEVCVCLGSGSSFVPRCMCEGQLAARIANPRTILVDAHTGPWGLPDEAALDYWLAAYPGQAWRINARTDSDAAKHGVPDVIDYLHVDADHSHDGALADMTTYGARVRPGGIITCHDTNNPPGTDPMPGVRRAIRDWLSGNPAWSAVELPHVGVGFAILGRAI